MSDFDWPISVAIYVICALGAVAAGIIFGIGYWLGRC